MRPPDHSIRLRAHALGLLALMAIGLLIHAYVIGRSPLPWWLLVVGASVAAVHSYRRSRK